MTADLPLHRLAALGEEVSLPGDQRVEPVTAKRQVGRGADEAPVLAHDPDDRAVALGMDPGRKVPGLRRADLLVVSGQQGSDVSHLASVWPAVHRQQPKLPWLAGLGVDIVIPRGKQAEKGAACEGRGESSRFLLP
jgi:hypothetical protein